MNAPVVSPATLVALGAAFVVGSSIAVIAMPSTELGGGTLLGPELHSESADADYAEARIHEIVLTDGAQISEDILADSILIPEGARITIRGNVNLVAAEWLEVLGTINVVSADELQLRDAPTLYLNAGQRLTIHGAVIGGRGRCLRNVPLPLAVGVEGGDGSSIHLTAPDILVRGLVAAGDGGGGGAGADGGDGGSVIQTGRHVTDLHPSPTFSLPEHSYVARRAGDGGDGGAGYGALKTAGDGGDAGSVRSELYPDDD